MSEQKNASAEAKGKWKKFPSKRYFKKIAVTARSCNVIPKFPSFEAIYSGDAATGDVDLRDMGETPDASPEAGAVTLDPEIEESEKMSECKRKSTQKQQNRQNRKRRGKEGLSGAPLRTSQLRLAGVTENLTRIKFYLTLPPMTIGSGARNQLCQQVGKEKRFN